MKKDLTLLIDGELCYIDTSMILTSFPPQYNVRRCSDDAWVKFVFCHEVGELLEMQKA